MMSFQDYRAFSKYRKEESIALFVETLTGTTFEMSVLPHDTIMSIKAKIQRIGGIPISQQHLIYNFQELDDSSLLTDYSIKSGSKIKLVLSMRGGPISTVRRVLPLDDAALRELMESNRDELLDDLPPGCKMAVLVFRDGDHLNMFRVLENVDGSYSPLSDSSMLNLFEDDGMLKTDEFTKRLDENAVTMEKMYDLKTKLAELAIQRKTHKLRPVEAEEDDEEVNRTPAISVLRESGSSKCKLPTLPPIPSLEPREESACSSASLMRKTRTSEFSRVPVLPEIASRASPSPRVATGVGDSVECVSTGFERERPRTSPDDDRLTGERVCQILSDASRLSRSRRCTALPLHRFPRVPPMANTSLDSDRFTDQDKDKMSAVSCVVSVFSRPRSGLERENTNSGNLESLSTTCKYPSRSKEPPASVSRFKVSSPKMSDVLNGTYVRSSDMDSTPHSPSEVVINNGSNKDSLRFLAKTSRSKYSGPPLSLESIKSTCHPASLTSKNLASVNTRSRLLSREEDLDRDRNNFHLQLSKNSSSSELLHYPDESSFTLIDDERYRQSAKNKSFSTYDKVPTVKASQTSLYESRVKKKKKEARARCTVCRKRLTVINTYTCRCGSIFCSIHRYSEAHDCDYDYKEEGRKILEQNNPLIRAPKLPKI